MRRITNALVAMLLLCVAAPVMATVIINVTTTKDEKNCNCNGAGCSPNPSCVHTSGSFPPSTGCSLREAMQNIFAGNNTSFPECTPAPETGATADNVINLAGAGGTIYVNDAVDDPNFNGTQTIYNGTLGDIADKSTNGKITVTGGTVTCKADPISNDGVRLFHVVGGDLTLTAMSVGELANPCTASVPGVAVESTSGQANLTLTNVTVTAIRSTNGGTGGCIDHGDGNLHITNSHFTGCIIDDNSGLPGFGAGSGGAIRIGAVGFSTTATLTDVTFQGNVAGTNGGALLLEGTDAIAITNGAFTGNFANGNTHDSGNAEQGGGAIYASGTAAQGHTLPNVPSLFVILNSLFTGNKALTGTGGAILLTNAGQLTYGTLLPGDGSGFPFTVPGGIMSTNFIDNSAGGTWNGLPVDNRAGSGGAIYASGVVSILDSSFVNVAGGNSSSNASGGAIAYYDGSASFPAMSIANVTITGSSAAVNGGAIANLKNLSSNGQIKLINDTISGNSTTAAAGGGAIFNAGSAADVDVRNTILANSSSGGNCSGPINDTVGNLQFNPNTGCASIANQRDPKLASALPFGGANFQVAVAQLNPGSGASGTGDPATCSASPILNLDAVLNGRPSPAGTNCDIGAFESAIVPDLTIAKSHVGNFTRGDVGDTYTITVTNSGTDFTNGTVTVTDSLPAGLTATAITGTNWNCVLGTLTCTRSDALANGASYEPITLTVDVATNAAALVTNTATVAGGNEVNTSNDSASDPTTILVSDLTITKTHVDPFHHGENGDTYTIKVTNSGAGATSGMVTVTDNLPSGLTATAIGGTGWTGCTLTPVVGPGVLSCSRSDVLAAGATYPDLILTVNVALNAPSPTIINTVTVAGGSESNTSNDTANDQTTTPVRLQSFEVD